MPNKLAILENVGMYNADELVSYIKAGIVTFDELCDETDGEFSVSVRKEVERKIEGSEEEDFQNAKSSRSIDALEKYLSAYPDGSHREEARNLISSLQDAQTRIVSTNAWDNIDKNSISALQEFCNNYPNDPHFSEAKKLIKKLKIERLSGLGIESLVNKIKNIQADNKVINKDDEIYKTLVEYLRSGKITHSDLLDMLKDDNNVLRASVINMLLDNDCLDVDDFAEIGINKAFVSHLVSGERAQRFTIPRKLEKINKLSTEIYFWGIPSSGNRLMMNKFYLV